MATGIVKWFNNAKGYGFILPENESEDLFVHYSSIEMEGYKTLKAGQAVNFDVIKGNKGSHAVSITFVVEAQEKVQPSSIISDTTSDKPSESLDKTEKSHLEAV